MAKPPTLFFSIAGLALCFYEFGWMMMFSVEQNRSLQIHRLQAGLREWEHLAQLHAKKPLLPPPPLPTKSSRIFGESGF